MESRIGGIGAVGFFPQTAGARAEDLPLFGQERTTKQRAFTAGTTEAAFGGVPVLPIIRHLALINSNVVPTRVAVLGVERLKAGAAVWSSFLHDVPLAAQYCLALEAAEVLHVPVPALCLGALISKDDLVTGRAPRLQSLGVVPAAVDLAILVEVDKVHQKLLASAANEAGRVPTHSMASSGCKHSNVAAVYLATTLFTDGPHHRNREGTNIATAQVLPFPLVAEELEFSFLLVVQAVAVAYLIVMGRELMEQLFDAVFLSWAVHVGHLVLRQGTVVVMNLLRFEPWRHPGVLLQSTARVIV